MNKKFTVGIRMYRTIRGGGWYTNPLKGTAEAIDIFNKNGYRTIIILNTKAEIDQAKDYLYKNNIKVDEFSTDIDGCNLIIDRNQDASYRYGIPVVGRILDDVGCIIDADYFWGNIILIVHDHYFKWAVIAENQQLKWGITGINKLHCPTDERIIKLLEASISESKQTNEYLAQLVDYEMRKKNEIQKMKFKK